MSRWSRAADFFMLVKYGQEKASPKEYVENDFSNRVQAIANRSLFLEQQLEQAQAETAQVAEEGQQASQMVDQVMAEAEGKVQEKDELIGNMATSFEEYKGALANIIEQAPDFSQLVPQEPEPMMQPEAPQAPQPGLPAQPQPQPLPPPQSPAGPSQGPMGQPQGPPGLKPGPGQMM